MAIVCYPLDNIDYSADDAMLQLLPISSGVYGQSGNFTFTVGTGLAASIGTGLAFFRLSTAKGFTCYNNAAASITFDTADPTYDRIDRVVLRWVALDNGVTIAVKKGTASSTPVAPARTADPNDPSVYELVLYDVTIHAAATTISAGDVTDQRLNEELCGLMANQITQIDMDSILDGIDDIVNGLIQEAADSGDFKPVKGVDYWTQQDQDDIVAEVLAAFNDVSQVGY